MAGGGWVYHLGSVDKSRSGYPSDLNPGPVAGALKLPAWLREVSGELDLAALCEVVVRRDLDVAFPAHARDETFVEHLRASVRENLRELRDVLLGRVSLQDVRLEQPVAFGSMLAQLGIPQTSMQRSYRVGFVVMWEEWMAGLRAYSARAGIGVEEALAAAAQLATAIFGYQDHVASLVAETHTRADHALTRSRAHVRQRLVRELLRGEEDALSPSDVITIGYDLQASHIAVLLPGMAEGMATRLLVGLRAATGVRQSLVHPLGLDSTVIWLGHPTGWVPQMRAELDSVLTGAEVVTCLGEPARGLSGFRRTLQQAQDAERIRVALGPRVAPSLLHWSTVSLEILLLQDPAQARSFVRSELGALVGDGSDVVRLRETLEASFRCGSHVATAVNLHVHEHTVRNRLRKAEERLGHPWNERATETQIALRLHRLLADISDDGA